MKKLILLSAAILFFASVSQAKEDCIVKLTNGTEQKCDDITASPNGDLSVRSDRFTSKIKKKDYVYACIPMPSDIKSALSKLKSKNYADAIKLAEQAHDKYKLLGWDLACLAIKAEAEKGLGKLDDAIKTLQPSSNYELVNPEEAKSLEKCLKVASEVYFEMKKYDECNAALAKIAYSNTPDIAGYALNKEGDVLYQQGKKDKAIIKYLQTVLVLKDAKEERAEALLKTANTLKEQNDNRAAKFAALLKSDYPNSPYISQLK